MPKTKNKDKKEFILVNVFSILLALTITFISAQLERHGAQAQGTDITAPTTTYTLNPNSPDGNNDWYITPIQVTLNATDLESGSTDTGMAAWHATVTDPEGTYSKDSSNYAPGFSSSSAKIVATGGTWHGINNLLNYAPTLPYDNMTASAWIKTDSITGSATFKVYAVIPDGSGGYTYQYITEASAISGTNNWTFVTLDFNVSVPNATGVYLDFGLVGPGTLWIDAVSITTSLSSISTNFTVASDSASHTVEYYSEDFAGNIETHSCSGSTVNCIEFKLDQTPPGNWQNSGAVRQIGGGSSAEHELWVFTDVEDVTSGLSTNSDKYQYHTVKEDTFGYFSNLLGCNSTWNEDGWTDLEDPVTSDGVLSATLRTQKTDFCDSNWKICKDVRFYAEDMAGNIRTKDLCLNGPWIKVRGEGFVRSNAYIDMLSEASEENTDGLVEINGISIDFFTSAQDWEVHQSPIPPEIDYEALYEMTPDSKTEISDGNLRSQSGVFFVDGNLSLSGNDIPNNYDSATFDQIVFVDGDLTVSSDLVVDNDSTAMFIVSGDVFIDESIDNLGVAVIADGNINTAYNLDEGKSTKTLNLNGLYIAENFDFLRTLQGTQNNDTPSESFVFEPKYLIQLRQFFDQSTIRWVSRL